MNSLKFILLGTILMFVNVLAAQDDASLTKRSELKINALYVVLGGLELDYEYLINEESSVGVSVTAFFDEDVSYNWGITPHYRLYFGKQPNLGFFVEGHASVFQYDNYGYRYDGNGDSSTYGGVGIAVGAKFKTSRDVVVEINGGIGRIFGDNNYPEAYPRMGINIGKRF